MSSLRNTKAQRRSFTFDGTLTESDRSDQSHGDRKSLEKGDAYSPRGRQRIQERILFNMHKDGQGR